MVILSTLSKQIGKHPIMSAFSLQNSLKIFQRKENPLNTLNGVRSLCMLWVVFGHQFLFVVQISENTMSINNQFQRAYFLLVEAGLFSVDTFFFIGGFLVAYAVLK
jgi:peptidoglycan/LPS O-acetylase OafA/YrhL